MTNIESPEKRGRKKLPPERVYEGSQFSTDDVADLERWVLDLNSTQGGVTLTRLKERFLSMKNLKVRAAAIRKTLRRLGYNWGPAKKMGKLKKCVSRTARIRRYLLEYSEALGLQSNGGEDGSEYVIVYMDESYIHQRHTSGHTWAKKNENIIRTGGGLGSRCIVVHAITDDGLLFKEGSQRVVNDTHELKIDSRVGVCWAREKGRLSQKHERKKLLSVGNKAFDSFVRGVLQRQENDPCSGQCSVSSHPG